MCDDPACNCSHRALIGLNGTCKSARGRFVVIEFERAYKGIMSREVAFKKETATKHLEAIRQKKVLS